MGARLLPAAHDAGHRIRPLAKSLVSRPTKYRPHQSRDFEPEHDFDIVAADFVDLAAKSGAA